MFCPACASISSASSSAASQESSRSAGLRPAASGRRRGRRLEGARSRSGPCRRASPRPPRGGCASRFASPFPRASSPRCCSRPGRGRRRSGRPGSPTGRASKRYCVEVSAPTGQSSITFPRTAPGTAGPRRWRSSTATPRLARDELAVLGDVSTRSACSGSRGCSARGRARSSARSGSASRTCASGSVAGTGGPQRNVRSCSGHSPPLSQTGQSSGWLTRMNSSVEFWPVGGQLVRSARSGRPSRLARSACSRPAASACPRPRRGTCGRRRSALRAAARSRRRESRSRRRAPSRRARCPSAPDLAPVDRDSDDLGVLIVNYPGRRASRRSTRPQVHAGTSATGNGCAGRPGRRCLRSTTRRRRGSRPVDVRLELGAVLVDVARTGQTAKSPSAQATCRPCGRRRCAAGRGRSAPRGPTRSSRGG